MVRQMLRNGQITLPKEIVTFFHLKERDLLEIGFDTSGIHLRPLSQQEFSETEYTLLAKKLTALKYKETKRKRYKTSTGVTLHLNRL